MTSVIVNGNTGELMVQEGVTWGVSISETGELVQMASCEYDHDVLNLEEARQEGVTTCQAAACHADSGAQCAEKLGSVNIGLQIVW